MEYIIMGLMLSIGWHIVKLAYEIIAELLFTRLHKTKWYQVIAGKRPVTTNSAPGEIKAVKNQIGFR